MCCVHARIIHGTAIDSRLRSHARHVAGHASCYYKSRKEKKAKEWNLGWAIYPTNDIIAEIHNASVGSDEVPNPACSQPYNATCAMYEAHVRTRRDNATNITCLLLRGILPGGWLLFLRND